MFVWENDERKERSRGIYTHLLVSGNLGVGVEVGLRILLRYIYFKFVIIHKTYNLRVHACMHTHTRTQPGHLYLRALPLLSTLRAGGQHGVGNPQLVSAEFQ